VQSLNARDRERMGPRLTDESRSGGALHDDLLVLPD
jgi:hypothetical protein